MKLNSIRNEKRLRNYCVGKDYTEQYYIVGLENTAHSNPPWKVTYIQTFIANVFRLMLIPNKKLHI